VPLFAKVAVGIARAAIVAFALAFLFLPLVAVFIAVPPAQALRDLTTPVAVTALTLSLKTTLIAVIAIVAFGMPLAYWLSRARFRGKRLLEAAVQMPIVVPPAVAGVGLLLVFGRRGMLGPALDSLHLSVAFSTAAVVIAQAFVAGPFFIVAARQAFDAVDADLVAVSRTLGASPMRAFLGVELPLAAPGILAGAALSWARALGEFGATMLFAGNLPGVTQTLPLAIYTALDSGIDVAVAMAALLLFAAFALLLLIRLLDWRVGPYATGRRQEAVQFARLPFSQTPA
jgi:molybdate transport system permease protein